MAYLLHWKWNLKKKTWELRLNGQFLEKRKMGDLMIVKNSFFFFNVLCFNSEISIFNLALHH